ncbi:MAG: peptidoglycan DD-metalloendopeptidase family protein [Coxiellaceae bacterium]|nr:peptidoglycan DD-metalloendopeptidase family protein [Coxiellaceae bacterium]
MRACISIKVSIIILLWAFLQPAVSGENSTNKLDNVLRQISKIKTDLTQKKKQQFSVKQQLNNLQRKIILLEAGYRKTEKNLRQRKKILAKLAREQLHQQNKLKNVQEKLVDQINLVYQIKQPGYFKVILMNRKKEITPEVVLAYHKYILIARFEQMRNIKKAFAGLGQNRKKIKYETQSLEKIEKKQGQQRLELEKTKNERSQVLNSLKNKIALQNERLNRLLIAKRNLETLVNRLTPRTSVAVPPRLKKWFCRNFIWPTKGTIVTHFGSPIERSSWKWNGIIISAPENQEIYAVSSGKVIYADWLTGYGLLLIIDHGHGYMSLYGHNKSFRRGLNAQVNAGEVIATVGKSDTNESGLYFAIRYHGKPINPENLAKS